MNPHTSENITKFRESPKTFIYEDEQCVAFNVEVNRQAPVHFLVAPKKLIPRISEVTRDDEKVLGHLLLTANMVAMEKGLQATGYHVIVEEDYQTTKFKSLHVFGRALHHMIWPLGPGARL